MHEALELAAVAHAWRRFIARFAPMAKELEALNTAEAFFLRRLRIHEYRQVLLRAPNLPTA